MSSRFRVSLIALFLLLIGGSLSTIACTGSKKSATPTPEITPVAMSLTTATGKTYTTQEGDTLYSVAARFQPAGETLADYTNRLAQANGIDSSNPVLSAGQVLKIPTLLYDMYIVQADDTLYGIAATFQPAGEALGDYAIRLATANGIDASNPVLTPGQVLQIPQTLAAATPTTAIRSTATPTEPTALVVYIMYAVQPGDTVESIAAQYGINPKYITWNNPNANDLTNLQAGELLRVPMTDGIIYDVKVGDTLADIAARYGVSVDDIVKFEGNHLSNADGLIEDEILFIPNGQPPVLPTSNTVPTPTPLTTPQVGGIQATFS